MSKDQNSILYSVSAEQSVLGTLIANPDFLDDAMSVIHRDDFYFASHRAIFKRLLEMKRAGRAIDEISLHSSLGNEVSDEELEDIAGSARTQAFEAHLEIVHELGVKRNLMKTLDELSNSITTDAKCQLDELIGMVNNRINKVIEQAIGAKKNGESYREIMPSYLDELKRRAAMGTGVSGLATGYKEFDEYTSGLQPADLVILAARPSMGKTTFAMNIAENVCLKGGRAMVFSLEMPKELILQRSVASIGQIDQTNLKSGRLSQMDTAKMTVATEKLMGLDIIVDDEGGLPLSKIRTRAIKEHRKGPLNLILLDYLQLMGDDEKLGNRSLEVGANSSGLKRLAKELNVPIIVLSQLNRSLEQRPNKRPVNSDLRDSGSIEQDADLILFIYRDEVYDPESEEKGIAELIIGKQRNGPLGTIKTKFVGHQSRFDNLISDEDLSEQDEISPLPFQSPEIDYVHEQIMMDNDQGYGNAGMF